HCGGLRRAGSRADQPRAARVRRGPGRAHPGRDRVRRRRALSARGRGPGLRPFPHGRAGRAEPSSGTRARDQLRRRRPLRDREARRPGACSAPRRALRPRVGVRRPPESGLERTTIDQVDSPTLRPARLDEAELLERLMKASTSELFPLFYDDAQTASAVEFVAVVDRQLIEDGTYFAIEAGGEVVACGGWSKRGKLYTGSGDAAGDERLLDPRSEPAHVRAMFVRPDWTRRGLGTLILEACEEAAR